MLAEPISVHVSVESLRREYTEYGLHIFESFEDFYDSTIENIECEEE